ARKPVSSRLQPAVELLQADFRAERRRHVDREPERRLNRVRRPRITEARVDGIQESLVGRVESANVIQRGIRQRGVAPPLQVAAVEELIEAAERVVQKERNPELSPGSAKRICVEVDVR